MKQQNRKRQRSVIRDESDPDCCSSSCSPLTILDNESIDDMDANSGDEVQPKMDEDSELEGSFPKKNQKIEPSTSSKPRSVYDMLNDVDKKKEGQMKKNMEPVQQKKRIYKKKPVVV